jgi:hypothetical protein
MDVHPTTHTGGYSTVRRLETNHHPSPRTTNNNRTVQRATVPLVPVTW